MNKLIFLLPLLAACGKTPPAPEPVRPVKVMVVGSQAMTAQQTFPGEVRAVHESPLAFRVGGKIAECRAELGATVKAGQVLARLEAADYQLGAQAGAAGVAEAQSAQTLAAAELARYRALREKGFVSAAVLEQKQAASEAATARLTALQSSRELQNRQLNYTELVADRDGVLTADECQPGQVVAAGQTVGKLAQGAAREIEIHLPEAARPFFNRQAVFEVRGNALPGRLYHGKLRELAAAADPASRTFSARISLLDADPALQLGMSASVTVATSGGETGLRLPLAAVLSYDQHPQVWKVDAANTVHAAPVTLAGIVGNEVRIAAGLQTGEQVVVAGANLLREGQSVRPQP